MDRCEDLNQHLAAHADGELEGALDERLRRHLDACEGCRSECAALKRVEEVYRKAPLREPSAADWTRTWAAIGRRITERAAPRTVQAPSAWERLASWWLLPAASVAAAVLLVALFLAAPSATGGAGATQVLALETGPNYQAMVRVPMNDDDVLVIDVVSVE